MTEPRKRTVPLKTDAVHDLRQRKGLSVDSLAGKVGVDLRTLTRWLSGESAPYWSNVGALATALGTTIDAIRADKGDALSPPSAEQHRFVIQIRLKGQFQSAQQKDHLVRLTPELVQALEREGIAITGQKSVLATSGFTGAAAWRVLVGVPGTTDGEPSWAIVAVMPSRLAALLQAGAFDDQLAEGEFISCGWGSGIPYTERQRVADIYRCHDDTLWDLTAVQASP